IVLRSGQDGTILIEDIANVSRTIAPQWTKVTANGKEAVIFQVYQHPGQNTLQIDEEVKNRLNQLPKTLLNGINYEKWYDQSELILSTTLSVRNAILIGILLSCLILYGFLNNFKVTLLSIIS